MEDPQPLAPPTLDPISRASSTSTSASASLTQLPGIQTLAAANAAVNAMQQTNTPQLRASAAPSTMYTGGSPAATSGGNGGNMPTCQNCSTSTTPLWRRDEFGSVLCNACGLFLKLHGRPRPISLKTDVIKSRNRVKTMRPDLAPKKKQQQQQQQQQHQAHNVVPTDPSGVDMQGHAAQRRTSQKSNGHMENADSPISRTGTPSMYNHALPSFMVEDPYQQGFGAGAADGRATSPMNGDRALEAPQTQEQLIAHNSSLKTRVRELEFINELFRGRLSQLEEQEAATRSRQEVAGVEQTQLRSQLEATQESATQLRAQLDDSHRRENSLKRRLDDLELELKELKDAKAALEAESERPAKKQRIEVPPPQPPKAEEPKEEADKLAATESKEAAEATEDATSAAHETMVEAVA